MVVRIRFETWGCGVRKGKKKKRCCFLSLCLSLKVDVLYLLGFSEGVQMVSMDVSCDLWSKPQN